MSCMAPTWPCWRKLQQLSKPGTSASEAKAPAISGHAKLLRGRVLIASCVWDKCRAHKGLRGLSHNSKGSPEHITQGCTAGGLEARHVSCALP